MSAIGAPGAELSNSDTVRLLARTLRYLAPFRGRVAVKLGLGTLSLLPMLLLPWPVKVIVDQAIEGIPPDQSLITIPFFAKPAFDALQGASPAEVILWALAVQALLLVLVGAIGTSGRENDQAEGYLSSGHDTATRTENEANAGFSLSGGLLGYFDFRWTIRLTQALNHHYRSKLFERIQSLPMSAFDDERIGDALYRVMYDTPSITNSSFRIVLTPILSTAAILMSVAVLQIVFGNHPTIVWSGLALLPLAALVTMPFARALRGRGERSREAGSSATATVEEGIANIVAVQSLGGEGREQEKFDQDSWGAFSTYRSVVRLVLLAILVGLVPMMLLIMHAFLYAIDQVIAGVFSRGDFLLFMTYYGVIAGASVEVGAMWFRVQASAAGLHRVFYLMDLPAETDSPDATPLTALREGIRLENVSYRYPDGTVAVTDVDLEARRGQITALVGPAGAGKTTLAHLLCGFLEPSAGRVTLDGKDLRRFTRNSLRARLAFVFQETALFDDTVEDNIRVGNRDASELEIRQAARQAGADAFIQGLPQGYQTPLGRGGGKLSVGQKQRLAIARALVRNAPILVLDEPTSALDPGTERALVGTLREAARDRLVLVIAHRLSTVRSADQILFVDAGSITERGTHDELMARPGGAYRRYVELQSRGAA